jgi:hypothetical protein
MDAEVNVALALSSNDERLQQLGAIAQKQEQILQTLGPSNPLVGLDQYAYTLRKMVELAGYKSADPFFKRVAPNLQPPEQPQQQPDPALLLAQAQIQALQAEQQLKAAQAQQKAALDERRLALDDDFRRDQLAQDKHLKLAELQGKFQLDAFTANARIDAEVNMNRENAAMQAAQPQGAPQ